MEHAENGKTSTIIEPTKQEPPKQATPTCPKCGSDPLVITCQEMQLQHLQLLLIFCGNPACRVSLNIQVLAVGQPTGIVIPGGGFPGRNQA